MVAVDRRWCEAIEVERELARIASDPACERRRRLSVPVRIVAVLSVLAGVAGIVEVSTEYGLAAGLAVVWVLPMLVLGVVMATEKLLLRITA